MELVRVVFVAHPVSSTVANVGWNCVFEQWLLLAQYGKWRSIQYLHTYGLSNTQSRSHKDAHIYIIPSIIHAYCTYGHRLLRNVVEKRPSARVVRCKYNGKVPSMRHIAIIIVFHKDLICNIIEVVLTLQAIWTISKCLYQIKKYYI